MFNRTSSFLFILIINQIQSLRFKYSETLPYFCDNQDKIDEIKNIKNHLKKLIINGDNIYFVLKNRILYTSLFDLHNLYTVQRFAHKNFFQLNQTYDEPSNVTIWGYIYEPNNGNRTIELHYSEILDLNRIKAYEVYFDIFNEYPFAGISRSVELDSIYLKQIRTSGRKLTDISFMYLLNTGKERVYFQLFEGTAYYLNSRPYREELTITEFANAKMFTVWLLKSRLGMKSRFFLLAIDKTTFEIGFTSYYLVDNRLQFNLKINLTFSDLFSCHTKLKDSKQLKGIIYDLNSGAFFIFINRFYLMIKNDLVSNGFQLIDRMYEKNAYNLKFNTKELYETVKFGDSNRKWIQTVKDQNYLILEDSNHYFEIMLNYPNEINLKQIKNPIRFIDCFGQPLIFGNQLICFESIKYYSMYDLTKPNSIDKVVKRPIYTIFGDSKPQILKNEQVELVFNYKSDTFVIMTLTELFVFNFNEFVFEKKEQILKWKGSEIKIRMPNCLLDFKCIYAPVTDEPELTTVSKEKSIGDQLKMTTETDFTIFNSTSKTMKLTNPKELIIRFLALATGVLILILILCIFFLSIFKKNTKNNAKKYKELFLHLPETLSLEPKKIELKVSFDSIRNRSISSTSNPNIVKSQTSSIVQNKSSNLNSKLDDQQTKQNYSELSIQSTKIMLSTRSRNNLSAKFDKKNLLAFKGSKLKLMIGKPIKIPKPIQFPKSGQK